MALADRIKELEKEQAKVQKELDAIARLREEFPDLETDRDRWGRIRYMAKSANARVTDVLFHRNCGCCSDSPVHARPYLTLEDGTEIYSNPCNVMIGEPHTWDDGFREYENWEKTYVEAGIKWEVIKTIRRYIERQAREEND